MSPPTAPTRAPLGRLFLCLGLCACLACSGEAKTPEAAAKAFILAAQRGDTEKLLPLLENAALGRLQTAAERASHHVGGRRTIGPHEMLQITDVDPMLRVARVEVLDNDGATARVRLHGSQGKSAELALIFEDDAWRVQIPLPPQALRHDP